MGGNWSGGIVPGAADNANFASNATYQVTWTASATNANPTTTTRMFVMSPRFNYWIGMSTASPAIHAAVN